MSSNITLAEAIEQRDLYLAASRAIAVGKSYTIGNRQLSRLDAGEVRAQLSYWQRACNTIESANAGGKNGGVRLATWT